MRNIDFEGTLHEFPDDATDDEIKSALSGTTSSMENSTSQKTGSKFLGMLKDILASPVTGRNSLDAIRDIGAGVLTGLGKGGQTIAGLMTGGRAPQVNMDDIFNHLASPKRSVGGDILRGIAEYAPYAIAGGPSLLGQVLGGAGFGAATTQPNEQNLFGLLPSGKVGGAIESGALNALTGGAFKAFNALRPSRILRGNLSPQELMTNAEAAGNTPTGLGDVIGSPFVKRQYENVLSKIPFSGAAQKFQQAGNDVISSGENALDTILGNNNPENIEEQLNNALIKKYKKHQKLKNDLYTDFNKEADKQFLDLPLRRFSETATEFKDAIEGTNILKFEPQLKKILSKLNVYKEPVIKTHGETSILNKSGQPLIGESLSTHTYPTAKEATLLKGILNRYARTFAKSPESDKRNAARIFSNLASSLREDINEAVEKSGNKLLKKKYNLAEENYKKNFSGFLDKDIYKFLGDNTNSDIIGQHFINRGSNIDKGKKISKISRLLEPKERDLLSYSYFSRALDNEGNLNPAKLSTLINNLGKRQFNALVPDKTMRNQLKNYNKLYKMNTKAVNIMQNPATGQQNLDIIPALLAHAGSGLTGGALGGIPGALIGLGLPAVGGKPLVHFLTNPVTRNALIRKMIENKSWDPNVLTALQSGIQGSRKQ